MTPEHIRTPTVNGKSMRGKPPELDLAKSFQLGIYKHFKGGMYEALFVAKHSEAHDEEFVVYKSLENGSMWIRPLKMFLEEIDRDGYKGPRFTQNF